MKFFAPALIFCGAAAFGQSPQVPHKMQFAGLTLTIRDDARREIQKDVDALTQSPKYFSIKVERAKTYFPTIEKIFAEERLPDDFKYLSLQESALISDAVSSSNAVGFWQFKDFTAQEMGLRVDAEVDERMNIASASRGAARYLKQCNHYFNNWIYALQAYQMGAGGVMRLVGDKDLGVRHMEITSETYWYVKKFLAHKVAFEDAVKGKATLALTQVYAAGGRTLLEIAKETSVDEQKLRDFNKWLKAERVPMDKEYAVLIPNGVGTADFDALVFSPPKSKPSLDVAKNITEEKLEINGVPAIRARKGETLEALVNRGNIGLRAFLRYNEMKMGKQVESGQVYFLHKKKKRAQEDLYMVKPGENLWSISQRFAVQHKSLLRFNRLEQNAKLVGGLTLYLNTRKPAGEGVRDISAIAVLNEDDSFNWEQPISRRNDRQSALKDPTMVGDKTPIQVEETSQEMTTAMEDSATVNRIHEVKATDTLYSVARQYGVTIKDLLEWNDKKDFTLSVGEKLIVRSR